MNIIFRLTTSLSVVRVCLSLYGFVGFIGVSFVFLIRVGGKNCHWTRIRDTVRESSEPSTKESAPCQGAAAIQCM